MRRHCWGARWLQRDPRSTPLAAAEALGARSIVSVQAPQWLVDAEGTELLLLPVMHSRTRANGEEGVLVLARMDAVAEAYELEGSRLTSTLMLDISLQVSVCPAPPAYCQSVCTH